MKCNYLRHVTKWIGANECVQATSPCPQRLAYLQWARARIKIISEQARYFKIINCFKKNESQLVVHIPYDGSERPGDLYIEWGDLRARLLSCYAGFEVRTGQAPRNKRERDFIKFLVDLGELKKWGTGCWFRFFNGLTCCHYSILVCGAWIRGWGF